MIREYAKTWKIYFLISTIFLIIYLIADLFFDTSASEANRSLTIKLQSNLSISDMFSFFSTFGTNFLYIGIIFLLLFLSSDKLTVVIFSCFHCLNIYVNSFLKTVYADGRPYIEYEEIIAISCEISNGKPSGHSQSSIFFYCFLNELIWNLIASKISKKKGIILKIITTSSTFFFVFMIGLSRVYKGVHSFNQVLLGWNYGQFILFLYFFSRKTIFDNVILNIDLLRIRNQAKISHIIISSLGFLFFITVTLLTFFLKDKYTIFPEKWYIMIEKKCQIKDRNNLFLNSSILSTSFGCIIFGIILGFQLARGTLKPNLFWEAVKKLKWWQWTVRFIVLLIIFMCLGIAYLIEANNGTNIYIIILLKNYLPCYLFGFGLIYLTPILYHLCKVDVDGDLIKKEYAAPLINNIN